MLNLQQQEEFNSLWKKKKSTTEFMGPGESIRYNELHSLNWHNNCISPSCNSCRYEEADRTNCYCGSELHKHDFAKYILLPSKNNKYAFYMEITKAWRESHLEEIFALPNKWTHALSQREKAELETLVGLSNVDLLTIYGEIRKEELISKYLHAKCVNPECEGGFFPSEECCPKCAGELYIHDFAEYVLKYSRVEHRNPMLKRFFHTTGTW